MTEKTDEIGILTLRAMNKPKSPEFWRDCFTDPVPLCERFRDEGNPICEICLKYFSPQPETTQLSSRTPAPTQTQRSGRLNLK